MPHQLQLHNSNAKQLVAVTGRQVGKALEINTPILTQDGYKSLIDVTESDSVYGSDGKLHRVLYKSPIYTGRKCYEVEFSNGEVIVADSSHDWVFWNQKQRKNAARNPAVKRSPKKITTHELSKTYLVDRTDGRFQANYSVDTTVIKNDTKELPIDSYFLGIWLGDGTSREPHVTTVDEEIIEYLHKYAKSLGLSVSESNYKNRTTTYRIIGDGRSNILRRKLHDLNLIKNKHIPQIYYNSSRKQRLDLLMGLIDSDGHVKENGGVEFCTMNKTLSRDFVRLVSTLGIKAKISSQEATLNGEPCGIKYRVTFTTTFPVGKLPRKKTTTKHGRKDLSRVYVWDVREVESNPVQCLMIDSEDHLFLAGDTLIPTHNTVCAVNELIKRAVTEPGSRNWYVTNDYKQAKRNVWDLLGQYLPSEITQKKNASDLTAILKNGSKIELIGVENAESLRGAAINFAICDEYADFQRYVYSKVIKPMFSTTNGDVWFLGTPKGLGNDLYDKFNDQKSEIFSFPSCEIYEGKVINPLSRYASVQELQDAYDQDKTPSKEIFGQEYLAQFVRPSGTVYSEWPLANFTQVEYDPYLPLHVSMDFGVNDPTSIIWIQPSASEFHVIDYYEASNANISHFASVINSKPYKQVELFTGDPAGKARTITTGTSPIEELATHGIHVKTTDGVRIEEQIRRAHEHVKSLYVDNKLTRFRDILLNYRYPEKKETLINQSNEVPIHDEFSHGARALEYYFVNYKGKSQEYTPYKANKWKIG